MRFYLLPQILSGSKLLIMNIDLTSDSKVHSSQCPRLEDANQQMRNSAGNAMRNVPWEFPPKDWQNDPAVSTGNRGI